MIDIAPLLGQITSEWSRRITAAAKKREPFMRVAAICTNFFQGSNGFLWEPGFREKYFSSLPSPEFKITLNKAFELVEILGPSLMGDYPGRVVKNHDMIDIRLDAIGPPDDPNVVEIFNRLNQERARKTSISVTRNSLMENYLNYAQREQPNGGLKNQSVLAIRDCLVTGRGVLYTEPYSFPGSSRVLTQSKRIAPDRIYIDPDCKSPDLSDAMWIAVKHTDPHWVVERRFGLEPEYLRNKCSMAREGDYTKSDGDELAETRDSYSTHDKVVWYEVFSKCGVGTRGKTTKLALHDAFQSIVGDFAYVCFVPGVDEPLNLTSDMINDDTPDEVIVKAFEWPVPYYMDSRWPVCFLDFYPSTTGAWPIAPMSPGIGHLLFMNIMVSSLASRVYHSSRNIMAVLKSASDDVIKKIKAGEFNEFIELNANVHKSIKEVVSFIESPPVNFDVFQMLDRVSSMFDKAVGLTETMYGLHAGGKVSRTAADVRLREEAVNIRPESMKEKVVEWQVNVANTERICAGWTVSGKSLMPRFTEVEAALWDQLIFEDDPEVFVREMQCVVEANSISRPNKARDNENLAKLNWLVPILDKQADSGNVQPFNEFITATGKAIEMDLSGMLLPEPPPPPDPSTMEGMGDGQGLPQENLIPGI